MYQLKECAFVAIDNIHGKFHDFIVILLCTILMLVICYTFLSTINCKGKDFWV